MNIESMHFSNRDLCQLTVDLIRQNAVGPHQMAGMLTSAFIARILCLFTDIEWEAMKNSVSQPCGRDGCDCHTWLPDLYLKLDDLREDARRSGVEVNRS